jgi:hypothetical protein
MERSVSSVLPMYSHGWGAACGTKRFRGTGATGLSAAFEPAYTLTTGQGDCRMIA